MGPPHFSVRQPLFRQSVVTDFPVGDDPWSIDLPKLFVFSETAFKSNAAVSIMILQQSRCWEYCRKQHLPYPGCTEGLCR